VAQADDRCATGGTRGDEVGEVDAVPEHDEADEDAAQAAFEDEDGPARDEDDDGDDQHVVGGHAKATSPVSASTSPFSSPCLSMPPPRLRRTSRERPMTTR